jgi:hypothetical protein
MLGCRSEAQILRTRRTGCWMLDAGCWKLEVGRYSLFVICYSFRLTDHRSPITDHRSPITDHRSPITDHRSPITDHRSPITDHRSPITGCWVLDGQGHLLCVIRYTVSQASHRVSGFGHGHGHGHDRRLTGLALGICDRLFFVHSRCIFIACGLSEKVNMC